MFNRHLRVLRAAVLTLCLACSSANNTAPAARQDALTPLNYLGLSHGGFPRNIGFMLLHFHEAHRSALKACCAHAGQAEQSAWVQLTWEPSSEVRSVVVLGTSDQTVVACLEPLMMGWSWPTTVIEQWQFEAEFPFSCPRAFPSGANRVEQAHALNVRRSASE